MNNREKEIRLLIVIYIRNAQTADVTFRIYLNKTDTIETMM